MKKLNQKEVRKETHKFIITFILLTGYSFLLLCFFYLSSEYQYKKIQNDLVRYKITLNKQQVLKQKIQTIYDQMSLLNTGKVSNDIFLEYYIYKNVNEAQILVGSDSLSDFKHYSFLFHNIDKMLKLKDTTIIISNKEQMALKDLNECIKKFSEVRTQLKTDPTRRF